MWMSEARPKIACLSKVSTILTTGTSSAIFFKSSFSATPSPSFTVFIPFASFLMISPNSASRVLWYCLRTFFMLSGVVSLGKILRSEVFLMNSTVLRSSGSSMATSKSCPFFLKATMLWDLAMGSGIIFRTSSSIFSCSKSTKGIPRI